MAALLEHIIINYRWVFVLFLLPISCAYDIYHVVRNALVFAFHSAPTKHKQKVEFVQKQVRDWKSQGKAKPMCTARPGWQTISPQFMTYKKRMHQIKINLVDILEIDTQNRTVTCEPQVTMGQLSRTLEPLGWTIPILPELDDLTVGGMVMGTGIETSSHKYGLFQHVCESYELVTSDGNVVNCSEAENSDLFHAVPWSYGTLGFLTATKIKIIPAKRFIKIEYTPVNSFQEAVKIMKEEIGKDAKKGSPAEFIECLAFSPSACVVMKGDMVDSCEPKRLNSIGTWHKPWFFKHVESFLDQGKTVEYIPLREYYHRHSRSIFWEIQDIIPFGNNVAFRYLLGWLIPPKVSLLKLTQGETLKKLYEENHMIQDMLVPIDETAGALEFFDESVAIYPIWLCPFRLPNKPGLLRSPTKGDQIFMDIGVYGVPKRPGFNCVKTTQKLESYVLKRKGFQMLYADSYLNESDFEAMFDHTLYNEMRTKYKCDGAFPRIYQKVNKHARA
ncbi:hypothetical protein TCAL_03144 [Tigriopus californicus]|uniref:Delta(24)-sterol reductase n=1 Tax=Tigriopus californicus TaxID=6832 RepID=A0A553P3J1_TIGCA|nr:delta(24)-sterol reductase-like [Tigriopus californicus]TRY72249.1 hypothetical protein TCAL_03144 [Tigriopus californicus]|eukprot:TCALIF_03144-PA protein Name:"Similar to DHCR24 Delta(24)-sterol reductase (Homo sapiens)" AED:0.04 eAED:0.04 QI:437/1/1/1/0.77/0.7/10/945/501